MLHFPSVQAPLPVDLDPPGRSPLDTCSLGQVGPAPRLTRFPSPPSRFPALSGATPKLPKSHLPSRPLQDVANTLATSIFSPGPMVEDSDTRLM